MANLIRLIDNVDRNLFLKVNQRQLEKFKRGILGLSYLGSFHFHSLLAVFLLIIPATRFIAIHFTVLQLAVTLVVQVLKTLVSRARPYDVLQGIIPFKPEYDSSFPSGHTASAFTAGLFFSTLIPSFSGIFIALASLVGFSRIYIGVHYPSDVMAGCFISLVVTTILLECGLYLN